MQAWVINEQVCIQNWMFKSDNSNCTAKNIKKWKGTPHCIDYKAVSSTKREFRVRNPKISIKLLMLPKMEDLN